MLKPLHVGDSRYVAIESMEATYAESVFVNGINGGLMCYADGDMDRPIALVQVGREAGEGEQKENRDIEKLTA